MNDYPFELWVLLVSNGGVDENGFRIDGSSEWVKYCDCYEQVLGEITAMTEKVTDNGSSFHYNSKIFLPENTNKIETGTKVQVREADGAIRFEGEARRFSKDIEHCRLWV